MAFDPDVYLAKKGFDPDAYLGTDVVPPPSAIPELMKKGPMITRGEHRRLFPPEQNFLNRNPTLAGVGKEFVAPTAFEFLNQLLGRTPQAAAEAAGGGAPEKPQSFAGQLSKEVAGGTGFLAGIPYGIGKAAVSKLGGKSLLSNIFKRAGAFGAAGALQTPVKDSSSRTESGLLGAAFGGLYGLGETGVRNIANLITKSPQFATKIRGAYDEVNKEIQKKFGEGIELFTKANPGRKVNLTNTINDLIANTPDVKRLQTLTSRIPKLKALVTSPEGKPLQITSFKKQLSLRQVQDIVNEINETVKQSAKHGFELGPSEKAVSRLVVNLKNSMEESFIGFAEKVRAPFADIKSDLELIKKVAGIGRKPEAITGAKQTIQAAFKGRTDKKVFEAMQRVFSKGLIQEIGGAQNMERFLKFLPRLLRIGALGATAGVTGGGIFAARQFFNDDEF